MDADFCTQTIPYQSGFLKKNQCPLIFYSKMSDLITGNSPSYHLPQNHGSVKAVITSAKLNK